MKTLKNIVPVYFVYRRYGTVPHTTVARHTHLSNKMATTIDVYRTTSLSPYYYHLVYRAVQKVSHYQESSLKSY